MIVSRLAHSRVIRSAPTLVITLGATPGEVTHAIILLTSTIGFPTVSAARSWAQDIFGEECRYLDRVLCLIAPEPWRAVIGQELGVVGRKNALVENRKREFQLRRMASRKSYRALLQEGSDFAFEVVKQQCQSPGGCRMRFPCPAIRRCASAERPHAFPRTASSFRRSCL